MVKSNKNFPERLKSIRMKLGISQEKFAALFEIGCARTVRDYELSRRSIPIWVKNKIEEFEKKSD